MTNYKGRILQFPGFGVYAVPPTDIPPVGIYGGTDIYRLELDIHTGVLIHGRSDPEHGYVGSVLSSHQGHQDLSETTGLIEGVSGSLYNKILTLQGLVSDRTHPTLLAFVLPQYNILEPNPLDATYTTEEYTDVGVDVTVRNLSGLTLGELNGLDPNTLYVERWAVRLYT